LAVYPGRVRRPSGLREARRVRFAPASASALLSDDTRGPRWRCVTVTRTEAHGEDTQRHARFGHGKRLSQNHDNRPARPYEVRSRTKRLAPATCDKIQERADTTSVVDDLRYGRYTNTAACRADHVHRRRQCTLRYRRLTDRAVGRKKSTYPRDRDLLVKGELR